MAVKKKAAAKKTLTRRKSLKAKVNLQDVIVNSIKDKKGGNIVSLDLTHINDAIANCFIICEAESTVQVKAIAEHIEEQTKSILDEGPWHKEGLQRMEWVLLDYVDCVVHIFLPQVREYYQLEELWHDAAKQQFS